MNPHELGEALRHGAGGHLRRRRALLGLSVTAMGAMVMTLLYQMGIIRRLPEPALPHLSADTVNADEEAYARLSTPASGLNLVSYAVTAVLIAMGGHERARTQPWIPLAMAVKIGFDAVPAGRRSVNQWTRHRTLGIWSLLATAVTLAQALLAIPEARTAAKLISARLKAALDPVMRRRSAHK